MKRKLNTVNGIDAMKIAAGIVVFNPEDKIRFLRCLQELLVQVGIVYLFDNSYVPLEVELPNNVVYMTERRNQGVAYALNHIIEAAKNDGYSWVLTMDQDSIIPSGLVNEYIRVINKSNCNIGIICPQVIDSRRTYMVRKTIPQQEFVDFCITSASCTSIKAWETVGRFDEWLFIDLIDNEFCKRLTISGYKILRLNNLILDQEFGKIIPKSKWEQKFWGKVCKWLNNENWAKFSYKKIVSPIRVYYTCRNIIYINKKMSNYATDIAYKENYHCNSYMGFVFSFILPSILRAQNKVSVIRAVIKGTKEGRRKVVDKWEVNT